MRILWHGLDLKILQSVFFDAVLIWNDQNKIAQHILLLMLQNTCRNSNIVAPSSLDVQSTAESLILSVFDSILLEMIKEKIEKTKLSSGIVGMSTT